MSVEARANYAYGVCQAAESLPKISANLWSMTMSDQRHQRFAARVIEAFEKAERFTDTEVKDAGGPSSTFMTRLRKVADGKEILPAVRTDTLRRIDAAANWAEGSARRLWLWEHEPVELDQSANAPTGLDEVMSRIVDLEERLDHLESPSEFPDLGLAWGPNGQVVVRDREGHTVHVLGSGDGAASFNPELTPGVGSGLQSADETVDSTEHQR